jgi:hypothetical protein
VVRKPMLQCAFRMAVAALRTAWAAMPISCCRPSRSRTPPCRVPAALRSAATGRTRGRAPPRRSGRPGGRKPAPRSSAHLIPSSMAPLPPFLSGHLRPRDRGNPGSAATSLQDGALSGEHGRSSACPDEISILSDILYEDHTRRLAGQVVNQYDVGVRRPRLHARATRPG